VTRHNAEQFFPGVNKRISKLLSRYVIARSKAIVAISEAVREFLYLSGEVSNKTNIDVVYYGYFPHPTLTYGAKQSKANPSHSDISFVVGTISRLTEQKDIPTLLNSFKIFLQKFPNSQLRIVGSGHLRGEMEKLADQLQISPHVNWLGRLMDVRSEIQNWDIFVLTSRYEGFGLVLLEAADANIPIVASNISAIPEVLGSSYRLLATPGDYQDFANKMISATKVDTVNYCETHNVEIISKFDAQKMASRLDEIYSRNVLRIGK
jgi:glycosyltransferase involved in cell wall biosynthesis